MKKTPKLRFPDNVIAAASRGEGPTDGGPRAVARARGTKKGNEWILWLYSATTYAPQVNFLFELPGGHKPTRPVFVRLLDQVVQEFEKHYGFDSTRGFSQVQSRDIPTNEAYGFYDAINTLAERLDLWEYLRGLPETPPDLVVRKTDSVAGGGCNFCPTRGIVYEVGSTLKVRMCTACVKSFRVQTKKVR